MVKFKFMVFEERRTMVEVEAETRDKAFDIVLNGGWANRPEITRIEVKGRESEIQDW